MFLEETTGTLFLADRLKTSLITAKAAYQRNKRKIPDFMAPVFLMPYTMDDQYSDIYPIA